MSDERWPRNHQRNNDLLPARTGNRLHKLTLHSYSVVTNKPCSALTLLATRQEEHPASKSWVMWCWRGHLSKARCRLLAYYGPANAAAIPRPRLVLGLNKSRMVLPFRYRLTHCPGKEAVEPEFVRLFCLYEYNTTWNVRRPLRCINCKGCNEIYHNSHINHITKVWDNVSIGTIDCCVYWQLFDERWIFLLALRA